MTNQGKKENPMLRGVKDGSCNLSSPFLVLVDGYTGCDLAVTLSYNGVAAFLVISGDVSWSEAGFYVTIVWLAAHRITPQPDVMAQ